MAFKIRRSMKGITIGGSASDKIAFHGATPVVQASTVAAAKVDYTTGDLDTEAEIIAAVNTTNGKVNSILTCLKNKGLMASA